ncbi:MAG: NADH dehydrogenase [Geobacteraceae bacterium GWC2_55_20]|nr:MAG: NADH dehydrogenase [Geobacteraceae bacterium GWC2_55_20]OGU24676.1 MAG: NADH dehydrogenase [Geobacteraceae bacterium GWF2_54_21]HCE68483.1 NADH-quinone oxidoreductase subunit M [Geobacter sp.]
MSNVLSLTTFLPILGVLLLLFIPKDSKSVLRNVTLAVTLVNFLVSLTILSGFQTNAEFQFIENMPWIAAGPFVMRYNIGIDGISLWLVILTTFIMPIAVLSTYTAVEEKVKEYMICLLMLETGMLGAFISLDLFLFYIFWEVMLIPMYFMIGIWGGKNKIYAAVKFFIYTMVGSLLMLVALIFLYFKGMEAGITDFGLLQFFSLKLDMTTQIWLFLAFAFAFAIKVPMFPLHTWLPDAHTEAPTAGSVILAAVLLKMGTYGYVRFAIPLFPDAAHKFAPMIATLAVIGIIYAALVAMVQEDVKKLVAYSSVAHLGFVMLGIFAFNVEGISGGMLQMLNHGISTGALFLIVGFIYERRHTRLITDFGGLSKQMPVFATIFMIVTLSSIGLPGTNGFVGEFLILIGSFESELRWWTVVATSGVILSAVYMLWVFQRVMFGELDNPKNQKLLDLNARELTIMVPLIVMIFVMGLYPKPFIDKMDPAVRKLVSQMRVAPVNAQAIPAGLPAGHPAMETPAAEPSMMPAGHPVVAPSSDVNTEKVVNPHEAK